MRRSLFIVTVVLGLISGGGAASADGPEGSVGVVDQSTGVWYLRDPWNGQTTAFYYGNPGDVPFLGDWNCDGAETPGLYRQSDGFVYLRNSNSQGVADIRFFFGNPGDIPLAGDFDGDGCDTVSIYRPSEARIYIINKLGSNDGGLGAADYSFIFGNPGDKPFVGDFDNDGIDEVGLHRESSGFAYFRFTLNEGVADRSFFYGNPGDQIVAANWASSGLFGPETVGIYRPSNCTVYLRFSNTEGVADQTFGFGINNGRVVAGNLGVLSGGGSPPPGCIAPPPPAFTFGNGTWRVGTDIPAGTYRSAASSAGCYAARLNGFGGTLGDIIANEFTYDRAIVTIASTDVGFESSSCGLWTNNLAPTTSSPTASFAGGYFLVGSEVAPGLWRNSTSADGCYWERLTGFGWTLDDIITNEFSYDQQTVSISAGDLGFNNSGCGTWTYLGP